MSQSTDELRRELREAGFANPAIDAVWPKWWSEEAANSIAASTELRYTLARRLGLAPSSLFEGKPRFVWRDEAKFKNLGSVSEHEQAMMASFGIAVGRSITHDVADATSLVGRTAGDLRTAILSSSASVGLAEVVSLCWGVGVPVVALSVFPLGIKRMHAMTVSVKDKFAILLARQTGYSAQAAYMIAHEIGHISLGHLSGSAALLEIEDPIRVPEPDDEERAADRFALTLLTGEPAPRIETNLSEFNATQLAKAAVHAGSNRGIDPGVLALCAGHATGKWGQAFGALKVLQDGPSDIYQELNRIAILQLNWDTLPRSRQEYLEGVLSLGNAA